MESKKCKRHRCSTRPRRTARRIATAASVLPLVLLASCGSSSQPISPPSPNHITNVTITVPSAGASFLPFYVGQKLGIYRKYGINLTVENNISTTVSNAELLAGKITFQGNAGETITGALSGEPERLIMTFCAHIDEWVVGGPGITKFSQLNGATVAGSGAANTATLILVDVLKKNKVTGYHIVQVSSGGDAGRIGLLLAGKAQGTLLQFSSYQSYIGKLNLLGSGAYVTGLLGGIGATTAMIKNHPALVKNMIYATMASTQYVATHEQQTVPVLEQLLSLTKTQAEAVWKDARGTWNPSSKVTPAILKGENALEQFALGRPTPPNVKPTLDFKYVPSSIPSA